jgi:hypothetical protein
MPMPRLISEGRLKGKSLRRKGRKRLSALDAAFGFRIRKYARRVSDLLRFFNKCGSFITHFSETSAAGAVVRFRFRRFFFLKIMQSTLFGDICSNRHKGATTSVAANKTVDKVNWQQRLIDFAQTRQNFTAKEFARFYGKQLNTVSGRVSELKERGIIEEICHKSGKPITRERCAVLRLVK